MLTQGSKELRLLTLKLYIILQVVLIAAKGGNKESYVAIDQFQFLEIDKGCELFPPEATPPTTPTTTEFTPTEPPNRKYIMT